MDAHRLPILCLASLLLAALTTVSVRAAEPSWPGYTGYPGYDGSISQASNWEGLAQGGGSSAAQNDCCSVCECMTCCCKPWHIVTGVEATYLKANVQDTPLVHLTQLGQLVTSRIASLDDYYAAPRVWLGMENCNGHGIRARYWDFQASSWDYEVGLAPIVPDIFDIASYNATNRLEAYTIDLEYTRRFAFHNWNLLGSIGARHARLDRVEALNSLTTDLLSGPTPLGVASQILSEREMNGTGLTLGLEGYRPLHHWNLNVFWTTRGSILWGNNVSNNVSTMYVAPAGLGPGAVSTANVLVLQETDTMYILECQIGLEWRCPLKCCCAEMFIRAAFEYQYWDVEESSGDYLTQVVLDVDPINFGETRDLRTDFTGLAFAIGVAW